MSIALKPADLPTLEVDLSTRSHEAAEVLVPYTLLLAQAVNQLPSLREVEESHRLAKNTLPNTLGRCIVPQPGMKRTALSRLITSRTGATPEQVDAACRQQWDLRRHPASQNWVDVFRRRNWPLTGEGRIPPQ